MKQRFTFSFLLTTILLIIFSTHAVHARTLPDFVPLIEKNKNAVVNITTTRSSRQTSQLSPQQIQEL